MPSLRASVVLLLWLVTLGVVPTAARAAPQILDSIELNPVGDQWEIRIGFASPVRTRRHAPEREGASIEVTVDLLGQSLSSEAIRRGEEVLLAPRGAESPLRDVRIELDASDRPVLLVRFYENVRFDLQPDPSFRSLVVVVTRARRRRSAASTLDGASASPAGLIEEGERAMTAGANGRAAALFTMVVESGAATAAQAQEALEMLGLARQRSGQIAHARAEYQEYLRRYPDEEGADRVRQRLAALDTAVAPAPAPRRKVARATPTTFDLYGTLHTSYFRTESFGDLSGATLLDSSQLADADVTARMRRGALDLRGRVSGYFRYDFRRSEVETPSRVTRLVLEAEESDLRLGGRLGRQSSRGAGVLGRFDGLAIHWGFHDRWTLKGTAGFPLASSVSGQVDTDRQVFGASIEGRDLLPGLQAELFAVGQRIHGMTDRIAAGIEARYSDDVRSAFGLLDVDFHFMELNVATLSGTWRLSQATDVNVFLDYRYSPILTSRNALIGQPGESLRSLRDQFGESGVEQLAKDRTPRVTTLVAGAAHDLTEVLDLNGSFTVTQTGGTPASGGVPGYAATDWEFYYAAQLVARAWLTDEGTERVAIRIFDGERRNTYTMTLGGRYYPFARFRVTPEIRFEYRDLQDGGDYVELDPRLRMEYRIGPVTLDADVVLQWLQGVGGGSGSASRDELGYSLIVGARYDF